MVSCRGYVHKSLRGTLPNGRRYLHLTPSHAHPPKCCVAAGTLADISEATPSRVYYPSYRARSPDILRRTWRCGHHLVVVLILSPRRASLQHRMHHDLRSDWLGENIHHVRRLRKLSGAVKQPGATPQQISIDMLFRTLPLIDLAFFLPTIVKPIY